MDSASKKNEYQEYFLGGKDGRSVGLTTFMCRLSRNLGALSSWADTGTKSNIYAEKDESVPGRPHRRTAPVLTELCRLQHHGNQANIRQLTFLPTATLSITKRIVLYVLKDTIPQLHLTSFSIFWNCFALRNNKGSVSTSRWAEYSSELTLGYVQIQSSVTRTFHRRWEGSDHHYMWHPPRHRPVRRHQIPHISGRVRNKNRSGERGLAVVWGTWFGCGLHDVILPKPGWYWIF